MEILYRIDESGRLSLVNRPDDGAYHVALECTGLDAEGRRIAQRHHFDFQGDRVVFGRRTDGDGTWEADFRDCVRQLNLRYGGSGGGGRGMMPADITVLPWVLVHRPPPFDLATFVVAATQMSDAKFSQLLVDHAILSYGPSLADFIDAPPEFLADAFQSTLKEPEPPP